MPRSADTISASRCAGANSAARRPPSVVRRREILPDYHVIRHMADIEVLHTYEGTETIQTLIVGRDITGVGAFA